MLMVFHKDCNNMMFIKRGNGRNPVELHSSIMYIHRYGKEPANFHFSIGYILIIWYEPSRVVLFSSV